MNDGQFWLTEEQFGRLEPHLPRDARGKPRVDDRRVISGIVHVLRSGGRTVIERMFGRLKDFRRIATRYDRSATSFMAAVHIVATVAY